jgi:hypothetical protein
MLTLRDNIQSLEDLEEALLNDGWKKTHHNIEKNYHEVAGYGVAQKILTGRETKVVFKKREREHTHVLNIHYGVDVLDGALLHLSRESFIFVSDGDMYSDSLHRTEDIQDYRLTPL